MVDKKRNVREKGIFSFFSERERSLEAFFRSVLKATVLSEK
jgi:hypothetical protein